MLGFLLGTVCLIGLVKAVRHGRHGHGCHGGWDDGGSWRGGFRRGGFGRGGFGRGMFLRGLMERLETTPGQEKVILEAFDEMRDKARAARAEAREIRGDIARAMRSETFDEVTVGGATARVEALVDTARKAGIDAFAKVHGVLEPEQRKRLADLIESGPRGGFGGDRDFYDHPYRRHAI